MKRIEMKVNHIKKDQTDNFIAAYLNTLGIPFDSVDSFINTPKDTDQDNPWELENMNVATRVAYHMLKDGAHVFVQVDSDTDGYTSSAVLINYIKRRFPNVKISYALHPGKEHGIVPANIPDDATLVIIPDAGSNNYAEQKEVVASGKELIILDHHEVNNYEDTGAILVNNQFSRNFRNKNLSGVGIVYMFIKAIDEEYFYYEQIHRDYLDLTAIGIVADAMNMTSLGNNYIAHYGLNNIRNPFIKELINQARSGFYSSFKNPERPTKTEVSFYIAPVINGVIRSGAPEDKQIVFRALTEENCLDVFESEWRGNRRQETLYQHAVRLAKNAKSRQDSAKKKSFEWLCNEIRANGHDKDNLIIATLDKKQSTKVSANVTGLIAMELVKEFNKPCLVLRETEFNGKQVYGGSGRNGNFYGLPSLLDFLHESNLVEYAEGHANAHGTFIEPDKVQPLRDYANSTLNPQIFDDKVFEVDYWFHTGEEINKEMLFEFAACGDIWGNGLPRPVFAFDFNFNRTEVQLMGATGDSVKIKHDGIDFIIFKNPEVAHRLEEVSSGHIQIVGSPDLHEWMGRQSIQVMINDINVEDITSAPTRSIADLI